MNLSCYLYVVQVGEVKYEREKEGDMGERRQVSIPHISTRGNFHPLISGHSLLYSRPSPKTVFPLTQTNYGSVSGLDWDVRGLGQLFPTSHTGLIALSWHVLLLPASLPHLL